jgi:hypothetical protein
MSKSEEFDPMAPRPNLDFSKGVRGKYYNRLKQGTNLAIIDPDLLDTFPDSASVNEALRSLKKIATRTAGPMQSKPAQSRPAPRQRKTASAAQ